MLFGVTPLRRIPALFVIGILLATGAVAQVVGPETPRLGIRAGNTNDLEAYRFFEGPMVQFDIRLTPEAEQSLRESPREYVRAEIEVDGKTYDTLAPGSVTGSASISARRATTGPGLPPRRNIASCSSATELRTV